MTKILKKLRDGYIARSNIKDNTSEFSGLCHAADIMLTAKEYILFRIFLESHLPLNLNVFIRRFTGSTSEGYYVWKEYTCNKRIAWLDKYIGPN